MNQPVYSIRHVIVQLVRGPIYQEDSLLWARLLMDRGEVESHFHRMGLELVLEEDAGYAFLKIESSEETDGEEDATVIDGEAPLPRLMRRNPLSFLPTVLLLELRERLLRHDQSVDGTDHLYLEFKEIVEFMRSYCGETGNEKKVENKISAAVKRLVDLSLLRQIPNRSEVIYRVEPILRAKLPVDQIEAVRDRLKGQLGHEDPADDEAEEKEHDE
jgi:hypothetical protein